MDLFPCLFTLFHYETRPGLNKSEVTVSDNDIMTAREIPNIEVDKYTEPSQYRFPVGLSMFGGGVVTEPHCKFSRYKVYSYKRMRYIIGQNLTPPTAFPSSHQCRAFKFIKFCTVGLQFYPKLLCTTYFLKRINLIFRQNHN